MQGKSERYSSATRMANPKLVPQVNATTGRTTSTSQGQKSPSPTPSTPQDGSSFACQPSSFGVPLIRESLNQHDLSDITKDVLLASWRTGTIKQYRTYLNKWQQYCQEKNLDVFNPGVDNAIEFLSSLFQSGLGYSAINTARSALSTILILDNGMKFGEHPLVCRFIKGIFQLKPSLPRYADVWDVTTVLDHLKTYKLAHQLTLKELTLKLTMLLCLFTAQRCQTIHLIDITHIQPMEGKYRITIQQKLKQTKPGHHLNPIELVEFVEDRKLCIVTHLKEYLCKTQKIRDTHTQLLLSYVKPFKPVNKETISRWVKLVLQHAGVDVTKYAAHSSRAASTSFAKQKGLNLQEIMKSAGWTSSTTFERFYNKPTEQNFDQTILS